MLRRPHLALHLLQVVEKTTIGMIIHAIANSTHLTMAVMSRQAVVVTVGIGMMVAVSASQKVTKLTTLQKLIPPMFTIRILTG